MDRNILDAPLENKSIDRPSRMAIVSSRLDFGINTFLMIAWGCCLIAGIISEGMLFGLAIVHFFLGCYQFGSALVGAIRGQRSKLVYFIAVIIYLAFLVLFFGVLGFGEMVDFIVFIGFFPLLGAIYFLKLSYSVREKIAAYD